MSPRPTSAQLGQRLQTGERWPLGRTPRGRRSMGYTKGNRMSDDSERRDGAWADGYNTAVLRALELGLLYPETVDWAREALAETLTHAKAEAWDEGWSERDGYCSEPFPPPRDNPYRGEHA